jgi:hypothetical protein
VKCQVALPPLGVTIPTNKANLASAGRTMASQRDARYCVSTEWAWDVRCAERLCETKPIDSEVGRLELDLSRDYGYSLDIVEEKVSPRTLRPQPLKGETGTQSLRIPGGTRETREPPAAHRPRCF